mmetsp:Transcript_71122/g.197562  ORF Transcript_71122/g.197562 Transcript_71122/m.197562 type:complete len:220 (+) Transcript_71122:1094-1753(+)
MTRLHLHRRERVAICQVRVDAELRGFQLLLRRCQLEQPRWGGEHDAAEAEQHNPLENEGERVAVTLGTKTRHSGAKAIAHPSGYAREAHPTRLRIYGRVLLHPHRRPDADQRLGHAHPQFRGEHQEFPPQHAETQARKGFGQKASGEKRLDPAFHEEVAPHEGCRDLAELVHCPQQTELGGRPSAFQQRLRAHLRCAPVVRHQPLHHLSEEHENEYALP